MSYFAGGGWRNPTSTLAQATTTTNTVSASRQGSVDESIPGGIAERKPLLRAQTDPFSRGLQRSPSQTSLAPNPSNVDATAAAGRRFTLRGVARALPYFLRPTAAATASVAAEEAERTAISASPPSQSVLDLAQVHAPVKRSALFQETPAPAEEEEAEEGAQDTADAVPEEQSERAESAERVETRGRRSRGSSNGSTIVTEEIQSVSQGAEDELLEAKKRLNDFAEQYSSTQRRVRELEVENEDKVTQMKLVQDAALKEKTELARVHAAEMEEQRLMIAELQESLQDSQRQAKDRGDQVDQLVQEKGILKEEIANRDVLVRDSGVRVKDLTITKEGLSGSVRKLQAVIGERDVVVEDFKGRISAMEQAAQVLRKEKEEIEAEIVRENVSQKAALDKLNKAHQEKAADATSKIRRLEDDLSKSNVTTDQLRSSLDTLQTKIRDVSHTAEERAREILRLQQQLSGSQEKNQSLESKVTAQSSQIQSMKATSEKELADLRAIQAADMLAQRRLAENLQTSLKSMRYDIQTRDDEVAALTHEGQNLQTHVKKLEDQCKVGEARSKGLESELAGANAAVQDLGRENKALQNKAQKEKVASNKQVDQLRKELDDAQKISTERASRLERLEATKADLGNALRRLQTTVSEKELVIQSLQRKFSALEETKRDLDGCVIELEQALTEARESAEHALEEATQSHEHEMTRAKGRIQELQGEVTSFIATIQQLHTSLETSRTETKNVEKMVEERKEEVGRLQRRNASLQDTTRALEAKITEATSRAKALEKMTREEKAATLRSHTSEIEAQQRGAKTQQEKLERSLRDKEEKLRVLTGETGTLHQEVATMKELGRRNEQDIEIVTATLHDVSERSKSTIERLENEKAQLDEDKTKLDGELAQTQHQVGELQKELGERNEELEKLKENPFHKMGSAVSNALDGIKYLLGVSSSTASRSG